LRASSDKCTASGREITGEGAGAAESGLSSLRQATAQAFAQLVHGESEEEKLQVAKIAMEGLESCLADEDAAVRCSAVLAVGSLIAEAALPQGDSDGSPEAAEMLGRIACHLGDEDG
ncbi:unnamed protein product, partial [Polarella glacialis]